MTGEYVFHAQHALTGNWVYRDVPYTAGSISWAMAGDALQLVVEPELLYLSDPSGQRPLFDEWATLVYAERDNQIRWGGIFNYTSDLGQQRSLNAVGFGTFLNGMAYDGPDYSKIGVDPLDVVRYVWGYVQGKPRGNLNLVLDDTTSKVKLGTPAVKPDPKDKNAIGEDAQPYELLWYNATDLGAEVASLAATVPFEAREEHAWADETKQAVTHRLRLGVPRLGSQRRYLTLVEGENVVQPLTVTRDAASYANEVTGVGAGEGSSALRVTVNVDDGRLYRPAALTDQSITDKATLTARASKQLTSLSGLDEITAAVIKDHDNAPFGSFDVGDDLPVTQLYGWGAPRTVLSRVTQIDLDLATELMTLTLARSDSFTYAPDSSGAVVA